MAAQNFRHALFCAIVTLIIAYPILGLNLEARGIDITLTGADTFTVVMVFLAAVAVFAFQLFRTASWKRSKTCPDCAPVVPRRADGGKPPGQDRILGDHRDCRSGPVLALLRVGLGGPGDPGADCAILAWA